MGDREGFQFRSTGLQSSDLSLEAPLSEFLELSTDIPFGPLIGALINQIIHEQKLVFLINPGET